MTTLVFVRHCMSVANVRHVFDNRPPGLPLTAHGRQQAVGLAKHVETLLAGKPHRIVSSPLRRARETAEIVAAASGGLTVEIDDGLRECDVGELEGKADDDSWLQFRAVRDRWQRQDDPDAHPVGGESLRDLRQRWDRLMVSLAATACGDPAGERVLLVSHGALMESALPAALMNVDEVFAAGHPLNHGDAVIAVWADPVWVCVRWGNEQLN